MLTKKPKKTANSEIGFDDVLRAMLATPPEHKQTKQKTAKAKKKSLAPLSSKKAK